MITVEEYTTAMQELADRIGSDIAEDELRALTFIASNPTDQQCWEFANSDSGTDRCNRMYWSQLAARKKDGLIGLATIRWAYVRYRAKIHRDREEAIWAAMERREHEERLGLKVGKGARKASGKSRRQQLEMIL